MNDRMTATWRTMARTRWLAELAETLELAGKIALELGDKPTDCGPATTLRGQIAALLVEVDSLRRAKPPAPIDPSSEWMI